jgi:DNA-binding NtrC family response regulator
MKKYKGLYVEDEFDNITIYTSLFESEGLGMISAELPMELKDFYPLVVERDIDFLIIDYHLEKKVSYKGTDVLREIRSHDSTIYAVLLTNYDWDDFKNDLGEYDYELKKEVLIDNYQDVVKKIRRACMLRSNKEIEASLEYAKSEKQDTIALLREISNKLDGIE